jgi:hypothetical protein
MFLIAFVVVYALCAAVLLLAVVQDLRRRPAGGASESASPAHPRAQQDLVFTTHQ